jgi:S1-C subfamily serine protease
MLLLGMVFGGAGAGAVMLAAGSYPVAPTTGAAAPVGAATGQTVAAVDLNTVGAIYNKVAPSVVMIESTIVSTGRFSASGQATGTGIVIDAQGDILTNNHVIAGATTIKVLLTDGSEYTATVVGTAPQDDLAVIKAAIPSDKLVPATLGDSSTVQAGDAVIAIGYPYGLDQSVTSGIVSGLDRDSGGQSSRTLSGLIQTDAAINPGNSGGPLLNTEGQMIGINTLIESPVEAFTGVGLAIPINQARQLLPQIAQGGQVERAWLGISGTEITAGVQEQYNLPVSKGILVAQVVAGGPAAAAGLHGADPAQSSQIGDIITAIDGQAVGTVAQLTSYLNSKAPGAQVALAIVRDGAQQTLTVTLQAWPASTTTSGN